MEETGTAERRAEEIRRAEKIEIIFNISQTSIPGHDYVLEQRLNTPLRIDNKIPGDFTEK